MEEDTFQWIEGNKSLDIIKVRFIDTRIFRDLVKY